MSDSSFVVIAIDGPAASGKSSVARLLAERLGYVIVNSGAMYRAVTWWALEQGVDPGDEQAIASMMQSTSIQCGINGNASTIEIAGVDPSKHLRDDGVNSAVSLIAKVPEVREILVESQRGLSSRANLIMEGRDIGSVVFPNTPYKFYIHASEEVREQRRFAQGETDPIAQRDKQDSSRKASPLKISEDAKVIDSSELNLEQVVEAVLEALRKKGLEV